MIADEQGLSGLVFIRRRTCRIRQHDYCTAEAREEPRTENHSLRTVTFIEMNAPTQAHRWNAPELPEGNLTRMARNGGSREVGDFLKWNIGCRVEPTRKPPESRAQHQADLRNYAGFLANRTDGSIHSLKRGRFLVMHRDKIHEPGTPEKVPWTGPALPSC
jgi:hypothetical protein